MNDEIINGDLEPNAPRFVAGVELAHLGEYKAVPLDSDEGKIALLKGANEYLRRQNDALKNFALKDFEFGILPASKTAEACFERDRLLCQLEDDVQELLEPQNIWNEKILYDHYDSSAELYIVSTDENPVPDGWKPPAELIPLLASAGFYGFWVNIYDGKYEDCYRRGEWHACKDSKDWGGWKTGPRNPTSKPDPRDERIRELEAEVLKLKCDLDSVIADDNEYREKWQRQCRLSMERLGEMRRLEAENARLRTVAELRRVDARAVREELDRIADWIVEDYPYDLPPKGEGNRLSEWHFARGFLKRVRQIQASNTDNVRFNPDPRIADIESQLATVTARENALREAVAGLADEWRATAVESRLKGNEAVSKDCFFSGGQFFGETDASEKVADALDAILKGAGE